MPTGKEKKDMVKEWIKNKDETVQDMHVRRWRTACEKGHFNQRIRDKMKSKLEQNGWI